MISNVQAEIPWPWYVTRASGIMAFVLLYLDMLLALVVRIPGIKKIFISLNSLSVHCWMSFNVLFFVLIHGLALVFDKFIRFSLADVFIPFASDYEKNLTTLGVIGFYILVVLIFTSYGKRWISHKIWRMSHFLNVALYAIIIIHALYLGTDLKITILKNFFIGANILLVGLLVVNLIVKLIGFISLKKRDDENIRESSSEII